jgi:hypothetical protein
MDIPNSKNSIKLSLMENLTHFGMVGAFLIFAFFPLFIDFQSIMSGNHPHLENDFSLWTLVCLGGAFIIWKHQSNLLKLESIDTSADPVKIRSTLTSLAKENNWEINNNTKSYFSVTVRELLSNEMLIVIYGKDKIQIGNINNPGTYNSFGSMYRFKKNKSLIVEKVVK